MCDLHSKFEEDRTKTAVTIMDDKYFGQTHTDRQTDRQTDVHSSNFISVQWHALHWTDNNKTNTLSTDPFHR